MREPLVHFVVAGFALFVVYALLQPERFAADTSRRIELSATDVGRVELAFIARWQRRPTPTELRGLLASEVRNEILSREAIALGLDKDDVRDRLATGDVPLALLSFNVGVELGQLAFVAAVLALRAVLTRRWPRARSGTRGCAARSFSGTAI